MNIHEVIVHCGLEANLLVLLLSGKSLPVQARIIFKWGLQCQVPLEMFPTILPGKGDCRSLLPNEILSFF